MQNKRLSTIKNITLLALMLALTIIFCFVPVQFGTITLALMILPTIILSQVASFKTSLAMGVIMGVVNYTAWFTTKAASPVAPIFQNPIVCIVPRILIAVVCYFTRYGLQKIVYFAKSNAYAIMNTCANLHMRILNSSTPARKIRQTLKAQISLKTATATSVFHTKRAVKNRVFLIEKTTKNPNLF